jgi:multiple sugar transport system permease protein
MAANPTAPSTGVPARRGSVAAEPRLRNRSRPQAASRSVSTRRAITPYLFLAPYLVLFTVFVLVPIVLGLWMSLHNWDQFLPDKPWVGLDNYKNLFDPGSPTSQPFWTSMKATGIFVVCSVPLLVVLPLGVALLLNRRFRGRGFFRAVFFAPYVIGVAVIGVVWRLLLDPNIGVINAGLGKLGLPADTPWTTGLPWAWVSLVGMTVWWTLGFNAIIYLAGLQEIDRALYDAARVDGANAWQRFRNVTLPGLRPVLFFIITVTVLASANMFGQSYLVTQGAPGNQTRTAIQFIAEEGFRNFRLGSAAAMSYVLSVFLMALSGLLFFLFRDRRAADAG